MGTRFLRSYEPNVSSIARSVPLGKDDYICRPYGRSYAQYVCYHLFWQNITEAVGTHNTLVLPLELLKEDRSRYLGRLFDFLDRPQEGQRIRASLREHEDSKRNARSFSRDTWRLRSPMHTAPRLRPAPLFQALGLPERLPLWGPDFRREKEIRLTPELKAFILDAYAAGNLRLDEAIEDVDLKSFGYCPPPQEPKQEKQQTGDKHAGRTSQEQEPRL